MRLSLRWQHDIRWLFLPLLFSELEVVHSKISRPLFGQPLLQELFIFPHELLNFPIVKYGVRKPTIFSLVTLAGGMDPFARE